MKKMPSSVDFTIAVSGVIWNCLIITKKMSVVCPILNCCSVELYETALSLQRKCPDLSKFNGGQWCDIQLLGHTEAHVLTCQICDGGHWHRDMKLFGNCGGNVLTCQIRSCGKWHDGKTVWVITKTTSSFVNKVRWWSVTWLELLHQNWEDVVTCQS